MRACVCVRERERACVHVCVGGIGGLKGSDGEGNEGGGGAGD